MAVTKCGKSCKQFLSFIDASQDESPLEQCLRCGLEFPLSSLWAHLYTCEPESELASTLSIYTLIS